MHVKIDKDHRVQAFYGFAKPMIGALAEATFYFDHNWEASRRVSEEFFSATSDAYEVTRQVDAASALNVVKSGARKCVDLIKGEQSTRGNGFLTFTVVMRQLNGWFVLNLGSNMALHITGANARLLIEPHSIMNRAIAAGVAREKALSFAGASAVSVADGVDYESEIRISHTTLGEEDWLLVVPGTEAAYDLALERQPKSLDELATIVEALARPYVQYSRSWLAVGPGESH